MAIIIYIVIFYFGLMAGYILRSYVSKRFLDYTGTIVVTKKEEKTVYTLVLDDYPEKIEFQKQVVFRVEPSQLEDLNRE
jgi:hypothetical protein